jgi:hypothetical protein
MREKLVDRSRHARYIAMKRGRSREGIAKPM